MKTIDVVPGCSHVVPDEVVPVPLAEGQHGMGTGNNPRGRRFVREQPPGNNLNAVAAKQAASNVRGGSRDPNRGTWCTPKWLAEAVGPFDLDPFSNPRSHIVSNAACWLERGDDGFGDGSAGSFFRRGHGYSMATGESIVWLQPPYSIVPRAFGHYAHTRWCALLRFDPRPAWFDDVYAAAELVAVIRCDPSGKPFNFEPPLGVRPSSNSFPHALFYRRAEDATPAALRHCLSWRKKSNAL